MSGWLSRARDFVSRHPRPFRWLFVAGLVFAVAMPVSRLIPRNMRITYELPTNHRQYNTLRVAYLPVGQDSVGALTRRFPDGAPSSYVHEVELAPGAYEVHFRLEGEDDVIESRGYLNVGKGTRETIRIERSSFPGLGR